MKRAIEKMHPCNFCRVTTCNNVDCEVHSKPRHKCTGMVTDWRKCDQVGKSYTHGAKE